MTEIVLIAIAVALVYWDEISAIVGARFAQAVDEASLAGDGADTKPADKKARVAPPAAARKRRPRK
jgi:hypothetical protein